MNTTPGPAGPVDLDTLHQRTVDADTSHGAMLLHALTLAGALFAACVWLTLNLL